MRQEEKKKSKKPILIIVFAVILLLLGFYVVLQLIGHSSSLVDKKPKDTTTLNSSPPSNPLNWPKPPLSCNDNVSLVPLTSYYVISGLQCETAYSSKPVLTCDGNTFGNIFSLNCYNTTNYSYTNQLVCNGSVSTTNNSLNYTCSVPDLNSTQIYSCNGKISNSNATAVSVPMSISCSS